ncbi:MAG: leucine-rich repeat domain-containing protein [Prevotella sp.]|nr:leucine-rich repeat domain-containing protein [Prevotella sp.]
MKQLTKIFFLTAALMATFLPYAPAYDFIQDGFAFEILSGETNTLRLVSGGDDYTGAVDIPSAVAYAPDGGETTEYTVASIAASAFAGNTAITAVTIPAPVVSIDEKAFENCTSLAAITFNADSCTSAMNAFSGCDGVALLTIGDNVRNIPDNFFSPVTSDDDYYNNANKTDTATVSAFPLLEAVTIPDGVIHVGQFAFAMCKGLTALTIGAGVQYIGRDAFADCPNLTDVHYNAVHCGAEGYHAGTMNYCVFWNDTKLSNFIVADGVENIPDNILEGEYSHGFPALTEIELPSSLISIGDYAFAYCKSLAALSLGTGVETIGDHTFDNCVSLTEAKLPDSTTSIGEYAFNECTALEELTIGEGVTYIGGQAFYECTKLATVRYNAKNCSASGWLNSNGEAWSNIFYGAPLQHFYFGGNVETIPQYLINGQYWQYPGLTTITIPAGVKTIYSHAFHYSDISTIICEGDVPATCSSDSFSNMGASETWLVVPEDAAENYGGTHRATKAALDGWSTMTRMREAGVTVTMTNTDGYVTRFSPYSYNTADNMTAYIVTGTEEADDDDDAGGKVFTLTLAPVLNDGKTVPAGTPVLLLGEPGAVGTSYTNPTYNDISGEAVGGTNYLHGTVASSTIASVGGDDSDYFFYMLSFNKDNDPDSLGFYWAGENGTAFEAPADKAWLALPKSLFASAEAASIKIGSFAAGGDDGNEEQTTGITVRPAYNTRGAIYTIAGQKVKDMNRKGIYIADGRKIVRK